MRTDSAEKPGEQWKFDWIEQEWTFECTSSEAAILNRPTVRNRRWCPLSNRRDRARSHKIDESPLRILHDPEQRTKSSICYCGDIQNGWITHHRSSIPLSFFSTPFITAKKEKILNAKNVRTPPIDYFFSVGHVRWLNIRCIWRRWRVHACIVPQIYEPEKYNIICWPTFTNLIAKLGEEKNRRRKT